MVELIKQRELGLELELEPEVIEEIEGESKSDRFKRMMNARYTKTVQRLRLLQNLANRQNYEYDDEDVTKVFTNLRAELDGVEAAFKADPKRSIKTLF